MKDSQIPSYVPTRTRKNGDRPTPILQPSELYKLQCPKCKKRSKLGSEYPRFSEWLHFLWCEKCEEQYPTIFWIVPLKDQEQIFCKLYLKEFPTGDLK